MEKDLEPLAEEVEAALDRLDLAEGSFLPKSVVDDLLALRRKEEDELRRVIVAAAVVLAARGEDVTPYQVLTAAADAGRFGEWEDRVKPEVKRILAEPGDRLVS